MCLVILDSGDRMFAWLLRFNRFWLYDGVLVFGSEAFDLVCQVCVFLKVEAGYWCLMTVMRLFCFLSLYA